METNARIDERSITTEVTVVLRGELDIPDWTNKEEYVQKQARTHVEDRYNNPRGSVTTGLSGCEEYGDKDVCDVLVNFR